jgi:microcystin-dependent protein
MKVNTLKSPPVNQNGYHKNSLTKERIGTLFIYPIDYTPDDCLSCDGYSLQINDYEELYKIIGTKFNQSGDATGTFRVPDYNVTKRFLQPGEGAGTLIAAGLPQHTHSGTTSTNGAHTHTAQSAGNHNHRPIVHELAWFNGLGGGGGGSGWYRAGDQGWTSTNGAHTHTTTSNGDHTHTMTTGNASNTTYGGSTTVQPPSQLVHICIKYK